MQVSRERWKWQLCLSRFYKIKHISWYYMFVLCIAFRVCGLQFVPWATVKKYCPVLFKISQHEGMLIVSCTNISILNQFHSKRQKKFIVIVLSSVYISHWTCHYTRRIICILNGVRLCFLCLLCLQFHRLLNPS